MGTVPDTQMIDALIKQRVDEIFSQRLEEKLAELKSSKTPSMTIIATKGTLDWRIRHSSWPRRPGRWAGTCRCSSPSTGCNCSRRT